MTNKTIWFLENEFGFYLETAEQKRLEEFLDLQNKELIDKVKELESQLAEKEKWYNELLFRYDERSKGLSYYQKLSINLQTELTELKEKHTFLCKQYNNLCDDSL